MPPPIFLCLLWPRRTSRAASEASGTRLLQPQTPSWLWRGLAIAAGLVAAVDLLYHNTGWEQFGYRFSNDYALLLMAMLAVGGFRMGKRFWIAAAAGVLINAFGAFTFHRAGYERFYYADYSQQVIYQPD